MDRYVRQRSLAQVGEQGQARIEAASYALPAQASASLGVARAYLERAGARHFTATSRAAPPCPHAAELRHPAARELAEGAWLALGELRRALELSP